MSEQTTRANIERQVHEYFPAQVAACEEFLELAADIMEAKPWRGRPVHDSQPTDKLIAAEAARGLKTYRGSLDAALGGFGPQAAMLNRALFESMATTCWATRNPQVAAERFLEHQHHNRALWSKRSRNHHRAYPDLSSAGRNSSGRRHRVGFSRRVNSARRVDTER